MKKDVRNEKTGAAQTPPKSPGNPVLQHVSRFIKTIQLLRSSQKILQKRFEKRNALLAEANQARHAEIAARQKAEAENRLLLKIIRAIGGAPDFSSALSLALEKICETGGWAYGEAWTPRADGSALECHPASYQGSDALETFRKFSDSFSFAPGVGLVGRVWSTKQPEWIEDISIQSIETQPRADIAAQAGLKTALAVPVLAGEQVLAVLIFFTSESRKWNEWHIDMSLTVASQLGSMLERKQAEQALRESEARFREFVEQASDAIFMADLDGRYTDVNGAGCRMLGYTREEIIGKTIADLIQPEDIPRLEQHKEFLLQGDPQLSEWLLKKKDGTWLPVEVSAKILPDGRWQGLVRDIAERKRVEEALLKAHEELERRVRERTAELTNANEILQAEIAGRKKAGAWLHSLIETTQDAVMSIDRRGRIVLFNPSAERIFGYGKDEIQGQKVNVLMANPYAADHDSYIERYERTGEAKAIGRIRTVEGRRKNGEIFPLELSVTQVATSETEEVHYAAFIRDISDKTALQLQLTDNERLAAIGTAMSVFAHEIGNPLNGMFVNVQLLERNISKDEGKINETTISSVKGLKNELTRLGHLLHDFRSVARHDQYVFRRFSLAALIKEIYAVEAETLQQQGIRVEQDFAPDLPPVFADHDKLEQALLNLWKNACEAMPDGGTLSFKASRSGDEVILEIKDTGIGIPKEVDIFEPFVTTKKTGTGLGLMIVRQIVSAHRGTVYYTSEQGKGTNFYLKFPVNPPAD